MELQLDSLSLRDAPLLQDLAAKAVIGDMKSHSPKLSIDCLVNALPFLTHAFDSSSQLLRECAAAVMSKLASTSARAILIGTGCLPLLVGTLESSSCHSLTSSDSMCCVVAHAADAMHSLFKNDTTRPAAAATAGVVSALVNVLGSSVNVSIELSNRRINALHTLAPEAGQRGSKADRESARSEIARSDGARRSNGKVQVAVTTALHALAKDTAHRQALAAAGCVKGLVAALKSDWLVSDADDLAELALYELAEDPTTAAAGIEQGGTEYWIEVLASLLHETEVASRTYWDEDEWEGDYSELEWSENNPTVVSAMMAAKVVNISSALSEGRLRLIHSSCGLQVIKDVFNFSSEIEGWTSDMIFEQLAMTMIRLKQGAESRDAVELPPCLQRMVDAGMNEQKVQQGLRDCLHTLISSSFKRFVLTGYSSD